MLILSAACLKPMDCLWCSHSLASPITAYYTLWLSPVGKYLRQYLLNSGARYQRLEGENRFPYFIGFCRNAATYMAEVWKLLGYCKLEKLWHVLWTNLFTSFSKALKIICISSRRRVQGSGKKGYYRLRYIQGNLESFSRKWCKTSESISLHKVLFTSKIGKIIYVQSV